MIRAVIAIAALSFGVAASAGAGTISAMAPLLIGVPNCPNCPANEEAWRNFRNDMAKAKAQGVDAIETDVWWGLVEGKARGQFDWSYYHKLASEIRAAGLKWIPILSTHECGGNVGDTISIPLPHWIWAEGARRGHSFKFKSEGGNESEEYISFWDTPSAIDLYKEFFKAFRDEFAADASNVGEVIVSAGPAGEMHYPSYNFHDRNLDVAQYPNRGAMQASSDSARASFRDAMMAKYGSLEAVGKAWGGTFKSEDELRPPMTEGDVSRLFGSNAEYSAYGQDLFDWYRASMLDHVRLLGDAAMGVFGSGSFAKTPFGYKMAGVHWAMDTRRAELTAGEISTRSSEVSGDWNLPARGLGYRPLLETVAGLQRAHPNQPITVYYTSGITPNGDENPRLGPNQSRAQDQSHAVAALAHELHLRAGFENALNFDLGNPTRVGLIANLIHDHGYSSASFLRLEDVVRSPLMTKALA